MGIAADALKWVNKIRKNHGKKPLKRLPKGRPGNILHCPIAKGLDGGLVEVQEDCVKVPLSMASCLADAGLKANDISYERSSKTGEYIVSFESPPSFMRFIDWFDLQIGNEAKKYAEK